jgi:hypothetical protein
MMPCSSNLAWNFRTELASPSDTCRMHPVALVEVVVVVVGDH